MVKYILRENEAHTSRLVLEKSRARMAGSNDPEFCWLCLNTGLFLITFLLRRFIFRYLDQKSPDRRTLLDFCHRFFFDCLTLSNFFYWVGRLISKILALGKAKHIVGFIFETLIHSSFTTTFVSAIQDLVVQFALAVNQDLLWNIPRTDQAISDLIRITTTASMFLINLIIQLFSSRSMVYHIMVDEEVLDQESTSGLEMFKNILIGCLIPIGLILRIILKVKFQRPANSEVPSRQLLSNQVFICHTPFMVGTTLAIYYFRGSWPIHKLLDIQISLGVPTLLLLIILLHPDLLEMMSKKLRFKINRSRPLVAPASPA